MEIIKLDNSEQIPMDLLLLADPSRNQVEKYLAKGECFVAKVENSIVGVYVLIPSNSGTAELKNIAVTEDEQGKGIGKELIEHAIENARAQGYEILEVGTGNSSIGQLALYQKCGFRIIGIDRDFFTKYYPEKIMENGIDCRDMIRLEVILKNNFPALETKRLKLVHINHQYDQDYFEIMSNDVVTEFYGMDSLKSIDQAVNIIDSFQSTYTKKQGIRWGIIWKDTNAFIGAIGLNNLSNWSKRAEIGYELHPDYWRRGIATEVIEAVLDYSFHNMNLFRMGAVTFPNNVSSNNLLEKIGFQKEGVLRGYLFQNNQSHDALVFSILKTERSKNV